MDAFPNTKLTNWCDSALGAVNEDDAENAAVHVVSDFMITNSPYGFGSIWSSSATPYWGRVTVTLPGTYYIARFECWNGASSIGALLYKLEYYDGAWNEFDTWNPVSTDINDPDQNIFADGYADVSKLRFTAYNVTSSHYARVYHLGAYGGRDTGMRCENNGTVWRFFGNYPIQSGDKVRIYDGTYTCGLDDVPTTDIYASPVYFDNGSSTRALAGMEIS